jgi:hypothetical protein
VVYLRVSTILALREVKGAGFGIFTAGGRKVDEKVLV